LDGALDGGFEDAGGPVGVAEVGAEAFGHGVGADGAGLEGEEGGGGERGRQVVTSLSRQVVRCR
jgi:hypothetical protein